MKVITSHITKHIIIYGGILYFFIRIINLTSLPIFNDEAIYLNWGRQFYQLLGKGYPLLVTVDGKQAGVPLLYGLLQFIPFDPLITVRVIGVFISLLTYIFSVLIFQKISSQKTLTSFILILTFCPYLLFFDRMALPDLIIVALFTVGVYLVLEILGKPKITKSVMLGITLAIGWWFKSTILLFFPPFLLVLFIDFIKSKINRPEVISTLLITLICFVLFIIPLIITPDYQRMSFGEGARILTVTELISTSPVVFFDKFRHIFFWFFDYSFPFLFLGILFVFKKLKNNSALLYLLIFFLTPLFIQGTLVKIFSSRYLVFIVPVFIIITVEGLNLIGKVGKAVLGVAIIWEIIFSFLLIFYPLNFYKTISNFPVSGEDLSQYFVSWTSGWGIREAVNLVKNEAKNKPTIIFVAQESGNPDDAFYVYFREKNFKVLPYIYIDQVEKNINPNDINLYFLSRGPHLVGLENRLEEKVRFNKPLDKEYIGVYNLTGKRIEI